MYYKIDGIQMPSVTGFEIQPTDMYNENTGRDEAGKMHLDLIRSGVRSWKIQHTMITRGEYSKIKAALNPRGFAFSGFSADGMVQCQAYATIGAAKLKTYTNDTATGSRWDVSLDVVEL